MNVMTNRLVSDEGTVVVFEGISDDDRLVTFAVDHRYAGALYSALLEGLKPMADVPEWAVINSLPAPPTSRPGWEEEEAVLQLSQNELNALEEAVRDWRFPEQSSSAKRMQLRLIGKLRVEMNRRNRRGS